MRPVLRGFLSHLAGYAAPHVVMAAVLAIIAVTAFTPGGESASPSEAALLQLFISAALLACSGVGYACAIGLVAQLHTTLRLPSMFGVIAGVVTFLAAAVGGVKQLERAAGISTVTALAIVGFIVGMALAPLIMLAARAFPKQQRA